MYKLCIYIKYMYICIYKTIKKRKKMRTTDLFIVIDDETLLTMKGKNNKTAKFKTESEANKRASQKLNLWTVVNISFKDRFIQHNV